jgi:hypothetical protein
MKTLLLATATVLLLGPGAHAGDWDAAHPGYRTVSWFRAHDVERRQVVRLCNDNAGLSLHNPTCQNAFQADMFIDAYSGRRGLSPNDPGYWRQPENAPGFQLYARMCRAPHSASAEQTFYCGAIRAAGG